MHALRGDSHNYFGCEISTIEIRQPSKNILVEESVARLVIGLRAASCIGYLVSNYSPFERIHTVTNTPHSSSEPQKPATPAPTPQQLGGKAMFAWFVPPVVVPAMLIIAVIALALLR
jgi:hypothetical protein